MIIGQIKDGIVLDHITAGHCMEIYNILGLDKLEHMHLGYFHDKQTGDLMSRIVNDTRDFELRRSR